MNKKPDQIHLEAIENLSKNLKKKISELGLSQLHLSALSGIEKSSITKIETMEYSNPTIRILSQLAKGLNTSIASLISTALTFAHKCDLSHLLS